MITTVTLNASVDKLYLLDSVALGQVMRVKEVQNTAGGKGLNVARVSALAGESVRALGFLGGYSGQYIRSMLSLQGVEADFTEIDGETRSCINIRDCSTGRHTEFLEPGASVTPQNLDEFLKSYENAAVQSDVITISGSVPSGTPADFYRTLVRIAKQHGVPVLVDTSGDLLKEAVKEKPTMIKPNTDEIAQLLGRPISSGKQLEDAAQMLQQSGIPIVAISMGKDGVLVACDEGLFLGTTPDIPVVNTVGCGDSMVAGFAVGLARRYPMTDTIEFASAISTANALSMKTGWFEPDDLKQMLTQVRVTQIHNRKQVLI